MTESVSARTASKLTFTFAWRRALAVIGWWQPVLGFFGMIVIGLLANAHDRIAQMIGTSAVAGIGALVAGIQASFVFAPADDPSIELVLSAPRPIAYLIAERLIVLAAISLAAALAGALMFPVIAPGMGTTGDQLARWVAPFVFMVGLGMAITLVSRRSSFGMLLVILLDGAMLFGGAQALIARFEWAWIVHLFLPPEQFTPEQIAVNRLFLIALGVGMIAYVLNLARDPEPLIAAAQTE